MTDTVELTGYQINRAYYMADHAVKCPKCRAGFGEPCESTGGGNYAEVPTHKARQHRTADWTEQQRHRFGEMVWRYRVRRRDGLPAETIARMAAEAEASAKPIPVKAAKQPTPKGVRLSENQAEEIERAAANNGRLTAGTGHFHGEATYRQTINALRDKGILAEGALVNHGYDREYTLTAFGWQVYRQHRRIIRNDTADHWAALNLQERR